MALEEIKQYRPVCDICGSRGSQWSMLSEKDKEQAVPEDWRWMHGREWEEYSGEPVNRSQKLAKFLICDKCLSDKNQGE